MCYSCWERAGGPTLDTPAVHDAAALIAKVYEQSCVGGGLHVIVDDWNVEDDHFNTDAEQWIEENAHDLDEAGLAVERACYAALKALTEAERYSALALYEGYYARPRRRSP